MKIRVFITACMLFLPVFLSYYPKCYSSTQLTHEFSNACTLPESRRVKIPRSVTSLRKQLGNKFKIVQTRNFIIATDLDDIKADYVLNGVFASCHDLLAKKFFDIIGDDTVVIYIFKNKKSYYSGLKKHFKMQPISPYGHYANTQRYIVVNYSTGPGTLVHELTHALMAIDFPEAPIWICEGMASLYEQCRVDDGELVGGQNWRLPELQRGIRANRLTPLSILFKSNTKEFRMLRESLHYAQSRYFCKYLEDKGLLARIYKAFRDNVQSDRSGVMVVEKAFGKKITEIEKDWIEWVKFQRWRSKSARRN